MENRTIVGEGFACYTLEESFNNITLFDDTVNDKKHDRSYFPDWTMSDMMSSTLELMSENGFIDSSTNTYVAF